MAKMFSSVSIMSRISKLLSFWVFHTVRQAARILPLGKGESVWAGPPGWSGGLMPGDCGSLTLAHSLFPFPCCVSSDHGFWHGSFLKVEFLFIGKRYQLESHTNPHPRCHTRREVSIRLGDSGLQGNADHLLCAPAQGRAGKFLLLEILVGEPSLSLPLRVL